MKVAGLTAVAAKMGEPAEVKVCRFRMPKQEAPMANHTSDRTCSFSGCERKHYGGGLCQPHYLQRRRGSDLKPLKIKWDSLRAKMEHYLEPDENGCLIWQLSRTTGGYGRVQWRGDFYLVHRQLWLESGRTIPDGLELDHLCRVRACANLDHLEPVTHRENMWRSPIMQRRWTRK